MTKFKYWPKYDAQPVGIFRPNLTSQTQTIPSQITESGFGDWSATTEYLSLARLVDHSFRDINHDPYTVQKGYQQLCCISNYLIQPQEELMRQSRMLASNLSGILRSKLLSLKMGHHLQRRSMVSLDLGTRLFAIPTVLQTNIAETYIASFLGPHPASCRSQ